MRAQSPIYILLLIYQFQIQPAFPVIFCLVSVALLSQWSLSVREIHSSNTVNGSVFIFTIIKDENKEKEARNGEVKRCTQEKNGFPSEA